MKQLLFMALTTFIGTFGSFAWTPVWGIAVYYMYAVLRPQFIWHWAVGLGIKIDDPDLAWSFWVAIATLIATLAWRLGIFAPSKIANPPWYGNPHYTRSHYLFLGFVAWISLTYPMARHPEVAYPYFLEYVKIFLMFICATLVLRTVRDIWLIYLVVMASAVYIGYEVNFYYLVNHWLMLASDGYGGLDNNGAALIFAMAVPMCFFFWEGMRSWRWWGFLVGWGSLLVIPMLIHAVLLSYSRGAMLSLAITSPLIFFRSRNKLFVSVVFIAFGAATLFMAGKEIQERFLSISKSEVDESANSRQTTWGIAIRMANESPLFGFGIRNSNVYTKSYGADIEGRAIHSQYLQTAADSGWVALALYLGLIVSILLGLRDTRKALQPWSDPETLRVRSLSSGLECSLVLFCIGAIFLSLEHFEMPYIIMLLAVQLHSITQAVTARVAAARQYPGGFYPPGHPGYPASPANPPSSLPI